MRQKNSYISRSTGTTSIRFASLYLAFVFVVMVLSQLFSFERFPDTIGQYSGWSSSFAHMIATIIVVVEVLAIPYLLGMNLPKLVRVASLVAAWAVLAIWIVIVTGQELMLGSVVNSGILGSSLLIPSGWWLVCYLAALSVLLLYVTTGGMKFGKRTIR